METDEPPPTFAEVAERAIIRIPTALVIAAGIIGLAIYARPAPPRYDAFVAGDRIVRVDHRSGSIIACEAARCDLILRSGQRLTRPERAPALPKPAPVPAR
ncbi:MAG: hypothetical protein ACJ8ER_07475 [Allosphingosinicella sp.]